MRSWILPSLLVACLLGGSAASPEQAEASRGNLLPALPGVASLQVLEQTGAGVVLELASPPPSFETVALQGEPCQEAHMAGLADLEAPGRAPLPVRGAMLGIPPQSAPEVHILELEAVPLQEVHALCNSVQPVLTVYPDRPAVLSGYERPDAAADLGDSLYPPAPVELVSTGNLRSQRFAALRFNPLQYDAAEGKLRYYSRMRVEVRFNAVEEHTGGKGQDESQSYVDEGIFEDSLRSVLVNYEQARAWRSRSLPGLAEAPMSFITQPNYKITVDQEGIYELSYASLAAAGLPVGAIDPRTFKLFNQGDELAIHAAGQEDGIFNPGEYLLFYGQGIDSKYTDRNMYWLTWGNGDGRRMENLDGSPSGSASVPTDFLATRHLEMDSAGYYSQQPSGVERDHWYWYLLYTDSGPAAVEFSTSLDHLGSGPGPISLRGRIMGYAASSSHHTRIYLNDQLVDQATFPYGSEYSFDKTGIPAAYLVEGINRIKVELPLDGGRTLDGVLVNWFEIDYYGSYVAEGDRLFFDGDQAGFYEFQVDGFSQPELEAFDISDPLSPRLVSGATIQITSPDPEYRLAFEDDLPGERRYLAQATQQRLSPEAIEPDNPSSLRSPATGADYIIISHADFLQEMQPLADWRSSQGYRVQLVDVQDVYDEFNGGVFSAEAIKTFLEYAYTNWEPPAPSYVLLAGDGNFDFKNVYGWNEPSYIPPYLDDVDPWVGETASDNRYASVSGDDILPDLYIGRFPARTPAEAHNLVQKTLDYEQTPAQAGWTARQLFVADNPDAAGNFPLESEIIIQTYVPEHYLVERLYYNSSDYTPASARQAILQALNSGQLLVHYSGHGTTQQWAGEGLLRVADMPALANGSLLPLFLPMTCAEGYFVWPSPAGGDLSGLGESLVRHGSGGAIASWSPAGYGLSGGHALLDDSLFEHLFNQQHVQLGYLTSQAKFDLYAITSAYNDLIETYTLFGDPALHLKTAASNAIFLPYVSH